MLSHGSFRVTTPRFQIPPPPRGSFALIALAAFGFLLSVYVGVWSPQFGLTKFLRVGQEFDRRGTAVFRATPKFIDPYPAHRWGFDGQLYAEMALDPLLRNPQLHVGLDDPPYRGRRILLPWLAWVGGLGRPFWVLNAYAAMNLLFWVGFAWLGARLFRPHGWAGLAGYAAMLLTCGIIECMQASLTDFPSFVLNIAAIVVGGAAGSGLLALAALARDTSLIGFVGLAEFGPPWRDALKKNVVRGLIAAVPLALWIAYVLWRFRGREISFAGGNLDWPFRAMVQKLGEFSVTAVHGPIRWHRWFFELYKSYDLHAALTVIALLTQSIYVLWHREWENRIWRWAAVVVVYFSCISFLSWESHFTVTRHALPITLGFNLLLAARPRRSWLAWFILGNCFVPFGIYYFSRTPEYRAPPRPAEYTVAAPAGVAAPVRLAYGEGWSPQQWDPEGTWRWASGPAANVTLRNDSPRPLRVRLDFLARTLKPRTVEIRAGEARQTFQLAAGRQVVAIPAIVLPPGETTLAFRTAEPPAEVDDHALGPVTFMIGNPIIRLE